MTKQHFQAIAQAVRTLPDDVREQAALAMATACEPFNVNFDRKRFIKLCGVQV